MAQQQTLAGTVNAETMYNSLVNERLMGTLKSISRDPFSSKTLISFGVVLMSNEIKTAFIELIGWIKTVLPDLANWLMNYFSWVKFTLLNLAMNLFKKQETAAILRPISDEKFQTMDIEVSPEYADCLVQFTRNYEGASFEIDTFSKLAMTSLRTGKFSQTLTNVKYVIPCHDKEICVCVKEALGGELIPSDMLDVLHVLRMFNEMGVTLPKSPSAKELTLKTINLLGNCFGRFIKENGFRNCISAIDKLELNKQIEHLMSCVEFPSVLHAKLLFLFAFRSLASTKLTALTNEMMSDGTLIRFTNANSDCVTLHTKLKFLKPCVLNFSAELKCADHRLLVSTDKTEFSSIIKDNSTLHLYISSPGTLSDELVTTTVKEFFLTKVSLAAATLNQGASIKISELSIENQETVEEKENPVYKDWIRLSADKTDVVSAAKMMQMRPDETIKIVKTIHKVMAKEIGSCKKPIQTLYLPKGVQTTLIRQLSKFRDETDLYERLGIPHKFGLLLHGPPGTGKSTTIKAIASFLGRDIFYINLRGVKTNKSLKMLFEHVHTMTTGGLIVFEDIDVMTPVVLKRRTSPTETNVGELMLMEDDELTLSYLLNLLDGPLCKENTVFAMTTNDVDSLDSALYREGRIDFKLKLDYCDEVQYVAIVESLLRIEIPIDIRRKLELMKHSPASVIQRVFRHIGTDSQIEKILEPFCK